MSRLPIRLRLTLFSVAAMAVVLAGAAWLLYLQVGSDLGSGIDQSLRSRAQDVGALVRDGGSLRSTSSPLIESGESFAELLSPRGRVLDASASLHREPLLGCPAVVGPVRVRHLISKARFTTTIMPAM